MRSRDGWGAAGRALLCMALGSRARPRGHRVRRQPRRAAGRGAAGGRGGGARDATPAPRCTPAQPDGACPAGRVCRGGACIVDLDPGTPKPADAQDLAEWIWGFFDGHYGAFPATNVDWDDVHQRLLAAVSAATTQHAFEWAVVSAVGELQDGHTYARPAGWCERTGRYGRTRSNTGACVVEVAGSFVVYQAAPDNPMGLVPGDEILAIDGRTMEEALSDLEAQPRCRASFSTAAELRDTLVASVLYRPATDRSMRVRRTDGTVADLDIALLPEDGLIPCDGRVGVPDPVDRGLRRRVGRAARERPLRAPPRVRVRRPATATSAATRPSSGSCTTSSPKPSSSRA